MSGRPVWTSVISMSSASLPGRVRFTGLPRRAEHDKRPCLCDRKEVRGGADTGGICVNIPFSNFQICPLLDARRKEVYAAVSSGRKTGSQCDRRAAIKIGDLLPVIDAHTIFLGEGFFFSTGRRLSVSLVKRHSSGLLSNGPSPCQRRTALHEKGRER